MFVSLLECPLYIFSLHVKACFNVCFKSENNYVLVACYHSVELVDSSDSCIGCVGGGEQEQAGTGK